jgi:hypothetical protein
MARDRCASDVKDNPLWFLLELTAACALGTFLAEYGNTWRLPQFACDLFVFG